MMYITECLDRNGNVVNEYCTVLDPILKRNTRCYSPHKRIYSGSEGVAECSNPNRDFTDTRQPNEMFCIHTNGYLKLEFVMYRMLSTVNLFAAPLHMQCFDLNTYRPVYAKPMLTIRSTSSSLAIGGRYSARIKYCMTSVMGSYVDACLGDNIMRALTKFVGREWKPTGTKAVIAGLVCIHTHEIWYQTCNVDHMRPLNFFMFCMQAESGISSASECGNAIVSKKLYRQYAHVCIHKNGDIIAEKCPVVVPLSRMASCTDTDTGLAVNHECLAAYSVSSVINAVEVRKFLCQVDQTHFVLEACNGTMSLENFSGCWDVHNGRTSDIQCTKALSSVSINMHPHVLLCKDARNVMFSESCDKLVPLNRYTGCWGMHGGVISQECATGWSPIQINMTPHSLVCSNSEKILFAEQCYKLAIMHRYARCWSATTGQIVDKECQDPYITNELDLEFKMLICRKADGTMLTERCANTQDLSKYIKCWSTATGKSVNFECKVPMYPTAISTAFKYLMCTNAQLEYKVEHCLQTVEISRYLVCYDLNTGGVINQECPEGSQALDLHDTLAPKTTLLLGKNYEILFERCIATQPLSRGLAAWNFFTGQAIDYECKNNVHSNQVVFPTIRLEVLTCYAGAESQYLKVCKEYEIYEPAANSNDDLCLNAAGIVKQCPTMHKNIEVTSEPINMCFTDTKTSGQLTSIVDVSKCRTHLMCLNQITSHQYECHKLMGKQSMSYNFQCSEDINTLACSSNISTLALAPIFSNINAQPIIYPAQVAGIAEFIIPSEDGTTETLAFRVVDCTNRDLGAVVTTIEILHNIPNALSGVCAEPLHNGLFNVGGEPVTEEEIRDRGYGGVYYAPTATLETFSYEDYQDFIVQRTQTYSRTIGTSATQIEYSGTALLP